LDVSLWFFNIFQNNKLVSYQRSQCETITSSLLTQPNPECWETFD
jgi:hypothetical protein